MTLGFLHSVIIGYFNIQKTRMTSNNSINNLIIIFFVDLLGAINKFQRKRIKLNIYVNKEQ